MGKQAERLLGPEGGKGKENNFLFLI
jgi:hypothetical protein